MPCENSDNVVDDEGPVVLGLAAVPALSDVEDIPGNSASVAAQERTRETTPALKSSRADSHALCNEMAALDVSVGLSGCCLLSAKFDRFEVACDKARRGWLW